MNEPVRRNEPIRVPPTEVARANVLRFTDKVFFSKDTVGRLADAELTLFFEREANRFVMDFEVKFLSISKQRIGVHRRWPKDWWQAFKDRWFPRWLQKFFPVVFDSVHVDQQIYGPLCPHVKVPDNRPHLEFLMKGEDNG